MSVFLSCDGPQCDHTIAEEFAREFPQWLAVTWIGDADGDHDRHFCSEDCALNLFARSVPNMVVEL